jgi:surface carbohydrate biosynthesis protein
MNPFINTAESRSHKGSLAMFDGDYKAAEKSFLSVVSDAERYAEHHAPQAFKAVKRELPEVFPLLYIPVEVAARELDARLLLALHAASIGFHVIIGQSWSFLGAWKELPPGVILFKTMNTLDAKNMTAAKEGGHIITVIDEEGIGRRVAVDTFKMNLDPSAVAICDVIFTQGRVHDDMIQKIYPGANTVVTGNPRAELFGEKYFANSAQVHLFCSKAGNVNPAGRSFLSCVQTTLALAGGTSVKRMGKLFRDSTRNELRSIKQFITTAREVSKHHKVVVRPHPVENPMLWHQIFSQDDVEVDASGSLRDWLKITETLYCLPECGTEHEATLAGVPVKVFGEPLADTKGLFESGSACENIVSELLDFPLNNNSTPVAYLSQSHAMFQASPFHRRKFPETSVEQIVEKIRTLKAMSGLDTMFNVTRVSDNQFYIRG